MFSVLLVAAVVSGFTGFSEITETGTDGYLVIKTILEIDGETVEDSGELIPEETVSTPSPECKAELFWVDRNHQAAIANESAISMDGAGILTSWYLNNDRIACYETAGSSTPLWNYSLPFNNNKMDVAAGMNNEIFSAASFDDATYVWLSSSSVPTLILDPGKKQDLTADGSYLVYIDAAGDSLICLDTATELEVWKIALFETGVQLNGVDISGDGTRVLVTVYDGSSGAQIYDMTDGSLVGTPVGNYSQTMAKISGDASRIVTGDFYGYIKVYEYDGVSWNMDGYFNTGDDWVTAVAISGDGETVAGGTIGFGPYRGKVFAIDWPLEDSPSELWQYRNYGDEVSSTDISEDGSVIVAGCWGKYNGTYGDVFTALDHSGNVIFSLLDDIDEPGSIFSVSVSSDGLYATASGKAVHARDMGNGGEVYSINLELVGIEGSPDIPQGLGMGIPYPNPVVSQMSVDVLIPQMGETVDLAVYDLNGRRIAGLNSELTPGSHVSVWNLESDSGEPVSAGLYFVKLSCHGISVTRKILVVNR
ncbi:MAG: T9SS type A sorting domain-containing protein [Candidatus Aegiribacteria sp.]|nr:T9SS type A sorting domain-containing protein [Candidatus Aegiribacteria sp.]